MLCLLVNCIIYRVTDRTTHRVISLLDENIECNIIRSVVIRIGTKKDERLKNSGQSRQSGLESSLITLNSSWSSKMIIISKIGE